MTVRVGVGNGACTETRRGISLRPALPLSSGEAPRLALKGDEVAARLRTWLGVRGRG